MALENLEPATRIESILDGEDIAPATRLEYFLKQAAAGGGGGGGGALIVVMTPLDPSSEYAADYTSIADKTAREIINAMPLAFIREELNGEFSFYSFNSYSTPPEGYTGYYLGLSNESNLYAPDLDSYPMQPK